MSQTALSPATSIPPHEADSQPDVMIPLYMEVPPTSKSPNCDNEFAHPTALRQVFNLPIVGNGNEKLVSEYRSEESTLNKHDE